MAKFELSASDGHRLSAFRVYPQGAPLGGVVVVQEIFGVNDHIRAVTKRFAKEGYLAVAPALFDRIERGIELGYTPETLAQGRELVGELDYAKMLLDLDAAVACASEGGKVGMVGYCFGGAVVWVAAARSPGIAAAVSYYGSRIQQFMDDAPAVPVMMHVGRQDASFPMEKVKAVGERYPDVVIHDYEAGHGFNCDMRDDFNPEASARAWERTLGFFEQHLR